MTKEYKFCHSQPVPLREKTESKAESAGTPSSCSPSIWAHIPGALLRNSSQASGRELAKHVQQIFRKVLLLLSLYCHFPSFSSPRLTFWLSAKEFGPWNGRQKVSCENRQNWQESTAIAAWLQVLVGTEPETKLPQSGWYKPSCPTWVSLDV